MVINIPDAMVLRLVHHPWSAILQQVKGDPGIVHRLDIISGGQQAGAEQSVLLLASEDCRGLHADGVHLLLQVSVGGDQGVGHTHVAGQPGSCLLCIQLAGL